MQDNQKPEYDIDSDLQDVSDYYRFFDTANEDLTEEDMDLLAAAGNYAAFRSRFGLDDESRDDS